MSDITRRIVRSTVALATSLLFCGFCTAQHLRNVFVPYSDNLKALADSGDTDAETSLAVAYLQGNGTKRDVELAASLFQVAYGQGGADAAAWLGSLYIAGQGGAANMPKGLALIKEAQDDGSSVGVRFAASALEKGIGQPANVRKALDLYQIAADQLDPVARDRMGMALQAGIYRTRDLNQAAALYDQASTAGYSWAQLHLGELYASNLSFNDARQNRAKGQ
jgi:TPR repeat protein